MGKVRLAQKIVRYFPPHRVYVEPFCGSAAVLLAKVPSKVEVISDRNPYYPRIYKFLKEATIDQIAQIPKFNWSMSRSRWEKYRKEIDANPDKDSLDHFLKMLYVLNFSFAGDGRGWIGEGSKDRITMQSFDYWIRLHERLANVSILHMDFRSVIARFDSEDTLFYLDPPYVGARGEWTRKTLDAPLLYDLTLEEFVDILGKIKGKFVASFYPDCAKFFRKFWIVKIKRGGGAAPSYLYNKKSKGRFEILVMNFKPQKFDIYAESSLGELPEFVFIPDFVQLTGSTVYRNKEPDDLDVVLKIPRGVFDKIVESNRDILDMLRLKLERIFEAKGIKRPVHLVPSSTGSNWDHIPIYDLVLRPCAGDKEEVEEPDFKDLVFTELEKEAEISYKEDRIQLFRFFTPLKTALPAIMVKRDKSNSLENFDQVLDFLKKHKIPFDSVIAQKKYDGNRVVIHADVENGKIKYFSDDGREIDPQKLKGVTKEILSLKIKSAIFDTELERWDDESHIERELVAGYLHSKGETDDTGVVVNIFDLLYLNGEDLHNLPVRERVKKLGGIGIGQSVYDNPDPSIHLNLSPSLPLEKKAVQDLVNSPASEGAMLKWGEYSLDGTGNLLKYKRYEELLAIVVGKKETKTSGVWNYDIGILVDPQVKCRASTLIEIGGKTYTKIGTTYSTSVKCEAGDIISVNFHTLNCYKYPDGTISVHVYEPIFRERHLDEKYPNSVSEVLENARISQLLIEKDRKFIEDIDSYDPSVVETNVLLDDHRILQAWLSQIDLNPDTKKKYLQKLEEIWRELLKRGISLHPERWRNPEVRKHFLGLNFAMSEDEFMSVPPENKTWRYVIQAHFRGRSVHFDLRLEREDDLLGWTLFVGREKKLKEPVRTLEMARVAVGNSDLWKIDLKTGTPLKRSIKGSTIRTAEIQCVKKLPEPKEWLEFEGVVERGGVGATAQFEGVFLIVDSGTVEYGATKPGFYEYFFNGKVLKGRYIIRALHYDFTVLGPSQPETEPRSSIFYVLIKPESDRPYVISKRAVQKKWVPPFSISALPAAARRRVPPNLKYWEKKDELERLETRDLLYNCKINFSSSRERIKIWRIWWKRYRADGTPVTVVRWGASTEIYLLKVGNRVWECEFNPFASHTIAIQREVNVDLDEIQSKQVLPSGSELNPTKNTHAEIEPIGDELGQVFEDSIDIIKIHAYNHYVIGRRTRENMWEFMLTQGFPKGG